MNNQKIIKINKFILEKNFDDVILFIENNFNNTEKTSKILNSLGVSKLKKKYFTNFVLISAIEDVTSVNYLSVRPLFCMQYYLFSWIIFSSDFERIRVSSLKLFNLSSSLLTVSIPIFPFYSTDSQISATTYEASLHSRTLSIKSDISWWSSIL